MFDAMSAPNVYKAPRLADVAQAAGVSIPTVSRGLNGTKYVAPELAARVQQAIDELGYRPNIAARSMRSGQRTLLSVFAGATSNYGYARTLQGIETAARHAGMSVTITMVESESVVKEATDLALSQPIAGAIVLEFDSAGIYTSRSLPERLPVVVAGGGARHKGPRPAALINETTAARRATEYLLRQGHSTVHHIAGPAEGKHSGRTSGWRAALSDAGITPPKLMHATWAASAGYAWAERIAGREDVTAVLCGNDEIAIGLMRGLADRHVRVPEDISVIGFDDQPLVSMWQPSLTTVDQDFEDLGARAFTLLQQLIAGESVTDSVATPELVVRESTAPPRP